MRNFPILVILWFSCLASFANGARILAVFPFQAKSHYKVFEPLLNKLAERGHEVVSVSHFPRKTKLANFVDVDISSSLPSLVGGLVVADFKDFTVWKNLRYLTSYGGVHICNPVLTHPGVQKILLDKERFDLMIVEIFATDCFLGIAHFLQIPHVIGAISSVALPWSNEIVGSPDHPVYVPNWFSGFTDRMDIFMKVQNTVYTIMSKVGYWHYSDRPSLDIARTFFGHDLPDFNVLRSKISLILTNGHHSISVPRVLAPGMKEIGGIHIPEKGPEPLDADLQDYLDAKGEEGVIYFSLGSQVDPSTIPAQMLEVLYEAFEELREDVLWKCDAKKMPDLPRNVKCIEWAPQLSVLCHPNVRLFITHGGLLGTQEAVYCGVPILGMPLFGDQYLNMAYYEEKGFALQVDFRSLSYEQLSSSLKALLTHESYKKMAQEASLRFRDRPIQPLHEAVYWVEYVLRHGGDSLKTNASQTSLFNLLYLDVLLLAFLVIFFVKRLMKSLMRPSRRR